jgi:hypothetical protein
MRKTAKPFRIAVLLLVSTGALAPPTPAATIDDLPFDQARLKGSHNTVDRSETIPEALLFNPAAPYQAGVRNVEFDLVLAAEYVGDGDNWASAVQHGGNYDWRNTTLYDDLMILHNWHLANPGHDVITVYMDLKNAPGNDATYTRKVEELFRQTLGDTIYTPGMLQGSAPTLLAGAQKGWPKLGALKDKFILVFSGDDGNPDVARRRESLAQDTRQRLAFVDIDQRAAGNDPTRPPYTDGNRVFINIQYGASGWCNLAVAAQQATGFVRRIWVLNDQLAWTAATNAAVDILSTDKVRNYTWAMVGPQPFGPVPATGSCSR